MSDPQQAAITAVGNARELVETSRDLCVAAKELVAMSVSAE
jgi:hypothetical protein